MKPTLEEKHVVVNRDLRTRFGATVTRAQLLDYRTETGIYPTWIRRDEANRIGRGVYRIPTEDGSLPVPVQTERLVPVTTSVHPPTVTTVDESALAMDTHANVADKMAALAEGASLLATIPPKNKTFVPFGDYDMIESVIASRQFFPIYICGLSGNGKTFQVEQACAKLGREYIRTNITMETDEDDLLGGFRLRDGSTVYEPGPAIVAMIRGAVLLLDEVDLASPKLLCLQPIMEGKPITLKKLGITIAPSPGFTVMATANTKGRGDEKGNFIGAGLLNEAFLERFPATVEQMYPAMTIEKKILAKHFEAAGYTMTPHSTVFFDTLCRWAEAVRATYAENGFDIIISTRRLCHIVRAYAIFGGDDKKALSYCCNRFDDKDQSSLGDLYNKLAPSDEAQPSNVGVTDDAAVSAPNF